MIKTGERQSQVSERLTRIEKYLEELFVCIGNLEDRIGRVLLPSSPLCGETVGDKKAELHPQLVSLAEELESIEIKLIEAIQRLQGIYGRCEL